MGGLVAHDAEVLRRLRQGRAEELVPEPVHGHAGRQGIPAIDQPAGEVESVGVGTRARQGREHLGGVGVDELAGLGVLAALEHLGGGGRGVLLHDQRHRPAGLDRVELGVGGLQLGQDGLVGLVDAAVEVAAEHGHDLGLRLGAVLAESGAQFGHLAEGDDIAGVHEGGDEVRRGEHDAGGAGGPAAGPEAEGHLGADVRLGGKAVGVDEGLLRFAFDEELDALGLARAIVGGDDLHFLVERDRAGGADLEGLVRPPLDDVHDRVAVLDPEIPAAEGITLVHAGEDRAVGALGHLEAHLHRPGLRGLEVTQGRVFVGGGPIEHEAPLALVDDRGAGELGGQGRAGRRLQRGGAIGVEHPARGQGLGDDIRRGGLLAPGGEFLVGLGLAGGVFLRQDGELGLQFEPAGGILGAGHQHGRRVVGVVAVEGRHRGVPEEGRQGVELLLADRVELVVVAGRATAGQAHPDRAERLDLVLGVVRHDLLGDGAALAGGREAAAVARGHDLLEGGVREEVAADLFDRELVEGLVRLERAQHPIAVGVDVAGVVDVDAVRVGVAHRVEPVAGHLLGMLIGLEQAFDGLREGVGRAVGEEGLGLLRRRRQAGQVEVEAAEQAGLVLRGVRLEALLGELGDDERIEGRLGPAGGVRGRGGADRGDEGPVLLVLRALRDPATQHREFGGLHRLVRLRRRHDFVGILLQDARDEGRLIRVALDDDDVAALGGREGVLRSVEAQSRLAGARVRSVAVVAILRQDRLDVPVEGDAVGGHEGERRQGEQEGAGRHEDQGVRPIWGYPGSMQPYGWQRVGWPGGE